MAVALLILLITLLLYASNRAKNETTRFPLLVFEYCGYEIGGLSMQEMLTILCCHLQAQYYL